MKKLWFIFALLMILFFLGQIGLNMSSLQRFASRDFNVNKDIFEKDSDGRGYSDIVKGRIDNQVKDQNLRNMAGKFAKSMRILLLSNNEKEYLETTSNTILLQRCVFYVMRNISSEYLEMQDLAYDSVEMKKYYEYLHLTRFGSRRLDMKISEMMLSKEIEVDTNDHYENRCH